MEQRASGDFFVQLVSQFQEHTSVEAPVRIKRYAEKTKVEFEKRSNSGLASRGEKV